MNTDPVVRLFVSSLQDVLRHESVREMLINDPRRSVRRLAVLPMDMVESMMGSISSGQAYLPGFDKTTRRMKGEMGVRAR